MKSIPRGLFDGPFASGALHTLRFVMHGATPDSTMSMRVAPFLFGIVKSYLGGDEMAEVKVRRNFVAPTERFHEDSKLWVPHDRIKAFLRKWYIDQKYRGSERYIIAARGLRAIAEEQRLPKRFELNALFGIEHWQRSNTPENEFLKKNELENKLVMNDETSSWTLEDILEVGGGCVYGRNEFNSYVENHGIYEALTTEFIDALADECHSVLASCFAKDALCLEVGAGDGSLSYYLRERGGLNIIASDSGAWRIPPKFPIEYLNASSAIKKYNPALILCSWMPSGVDLTKVFRDAPSVQAYILLGEIDDGACGHPWLTWGVPTTSSIVQKNNTEITTTTPVAPYIADGFTRSELCKVSKHQISRYDCETFLGNSHTVLFSRGSRN
mmetsp:Transcript_22412/g.29021  ORF Transcript_22412/g.29021 Transcript_22412/m.29021 type:complete len:385 (+) Transcript_22412:91-1245(+)